MHRFSREGAVILGLVRELKSRGDVSIIIIAHNYSHIVEVCDWVNLLQHGRIALDKPTGETSVEELTRLGGGRTPLCCFCYCEDCRRASGAGAVPFMDYEKQSLRVAGETREARKRLRSGRTSVRDFCPACGSSMFGGEYGVSARIPSTQAPATTRPPSTRPAL